MPLLSAVRRTAVRPLSSPNERLGVWDCSSLWLLSYLLERVHCVDSENLPTIDQRPSNSPTRQKQKATGQNEKRSLDESEKGGPKQKERISMAKGCSFSKNRCNEAMIIVQGIGSFNFNILFNDFGTDGGPAAKCPLKTSEGNDYSGTNGKVIEFNAYANIFYLLQNLMLIVDNIQKYNLPLTPKQCTGCCLSSKCLLTALFHEVANECRKIFYFVFGKDIRKSFRSLVVLMATIYYDIGSCCFKNYLVKLTTRLREVFNTRKEKWKIRNVKSVKYTTLLDTFTMSSLAKLEFLALDINVTDEDMLEKTFSTFHVSNMLLQQQYRKRGFKKYSELISCLLVAEQNNELLMKNHESRPTGATLFPEVNVVVVEVVVEVVTMVKEEIIIFYVVIII
uniref:Uncharacterized protein n=1 Tax=Cucumis melo TaxID=3656 RepID=A0A9I9EF19_CUCME